MVFENHDELVPVRHHRGGNSHKKKLLAALTHKTIP